MTDTNAKQDVRGMSERARSLLQAILDNDPNDDAADGIVLLDVWRKEIESILSAPPPPQQWNEFAFEAGAVQLHHELGITITAARIAMTRAFTAAAPFLSAPQADAGAGWKLVPVEPTKEMKIEGGNACRVMSANSAEFRALYVYRTMLAAAPLPPTAEQDSSL